MSFTMGMYVMPKYKNCGPIEVYTVEEYFNYQRTTNKKISFVEWYKNKSGFNNYSDEELERYFTDDMLKFYKRHYRKMYWPFDYAKKQPFYRIAEDMTAFEWDNAFHICDWFIANADTTRGCHMVDKQILNKLLKVCETVWYDTDKAPEILPIKEDEGTYDVHYFNCVENTYGVVSRVLAEVDFEKYMIDIDFD